MDSLRTGGIANAITAQKLMEAKGLDTSAIDAKIQAAYGKLNNVQKGVVNFLTSEKMMAGHIENVTKSNPSYANYKGSPTTPTSKNNLQEKNNQDDNEDRRQDDKRKKKQLKK